MVISWKKHVKVSLAFSLKNEKYSAYLINRLVGKVKVKTKIIWNTRRIQSLFQLKDKLQYLNCVKGICSFGETYVGETKRNSKIGWDEHNDEKKKKKKKQY